MSFDKVSAQKSSRFNWWSNIKKNSDNLQYEDGFSTYEIKTLLANQGITDASEEAIESLMAECPELNEIEDGYYILADKENNSIMPEPECPAITEEQVNDETTEVITKDMIMQKTVSDTKQIVLRLNKNIIRAYDYSDALNKVCEFAINCKPFRMARIAGQGIHLKDCNVFYRKTVPVDGYNKLSNGLQITAIYTITDLHTITDEVKKYCQIDDDMITIISK